MENFKPGEYCRFPNEQIPRILDILRANGHDVAHGWPPHLSEGIVASGQCLYPFGHVGVPSEKASKKLTELSKHDFMVKALRLEEGMGIANGMNTEQRKHISEEIERVGIKIHFPGRKGIRSEFNHVFYFSRDDGFVSKVTFTQSLPYEQWCKMLCVEPIPTSAENAQVEKTLEQHVDEYDAGKRMVTVNDLDTDGNLFQKQIPFNPNDPWEMSHNHSNWYDCKNRYYIGMDREGKHVVQYTDMPEQYEVFKFVRNIEFTAAMLEVGEWMVVEYDESGTIGKQHLIATNDLTIVCAETGLSFDKEDGHVFKGRKVNVEIKTYEP